MTINPDLMGNNSYFLHKCQLAAWGLRVVPSFMFASGMIIEVCHEMSGCRFFEGELELGFLPYKEVA
jgi:hypothetical protein